MINISKNPYIFGVPVGLTSIISGYATVTSSGLASTIEHNYFLRVPFLLGSSSIEGSNLNTKDQTDDRNKVIEKNKERLLAFYRKYNSQDIKVNVANVRNSEVLDFFLHFRSAKASKNLNSLWLQNVHLNQLSIDRYGYEYDSSGNKKTNTTPKLTEIVKWSDVGLNDFNFVAREKDQEPHISFNFFNNDISEDEVKILTNEDANKYKIDEGNYWSNDWFVWVDKDLLALRLNYVLQTYVFNKQEAQSQSQISAVIGNTSNRSTPQQSKFDAIKANFEALTPEEKDFANDYIKLFIDTSTDTNWSKVASSVTTESSFITAKDLTKIYVGLNKNQKSTILFQPHLITRITSGAAGTWKKSLALAKEEKKEEEVKKAESIVEEQVKESYVIRKIEKINASSEEDSLTKNKIKLFVDSEVNPLINLQEVHNKIKNFSVLGLSLKTQEKNKNIWSSSVYSQLDSDKNHEGLYVLDIPHSNDYGL